MSQTKSSDTGPETFVETSLKLSGKSEEEARSTGAMDRADEQLESFFESRYQTTASPIHRAVWDHDFPLELFQAGPPAKPTPACANCMEESLSIVHRHIAAGTLLNENGKLLPHVFAELGAAGYWGLLVEKEYGGHASPCRSLCRFSRAWPPSFRPWPDSAACTVASRAVDPLHGMGTPDQKQRFLTRLANGERISGFALTEPGAGSDMTALRNAGRARRR